MLDLFQRQLNNHSAILFFTAVLLMPLNWGIETWKWRLLINRIQKISFTKSFRAVLSGITLSVITPARLGEYVGRVMVLEKSKRWRAIPVTVLASVAQFIVIAVVGMSGGFIFAKREGFFDDQSGSVVLAVSIALSILFILLYFFPNYLVQLSKSARAPKKIQSYLSTLKRFDRNDQIRTLLLSALRYFVYSLQYFLLLRAFGMEINFIEGMGAISIIFLIQTLIPFLPSVIELGFRGNMALFVFNDFAQSELSILAAVLSIWIINLMIPALTGYLFIARRKF